MDARNEDALGETMLQLRATVVEYDDAPDECTIFPGNVSEWERLTTWITAQEGSFVDLQSVR